MRACVRVCVFVCNSQKCINIVSVQIPPQNLPVYPSFPVEFNTFLSSGKQSVVYVSVHGLLNNYRRMHMGREVAGVRGERACEIQTIERRGGGGGVG